MSKKIAVVTGAGSPGYARAITEKLLDVGYQVIGTFQADDARVAREFASSRPDLALHEVNLQIRDELKRFVKALAGSRLHLLVNAQFYWNMERPEQFDHDAWD